MTVIIKTLEIIILIVAFVHIITTLITGRKLISQFKCNKCKRNTKVMNGVCSNCGNKLTRKSLYRFKSLFFGEVSIKDKEGNNVLGKAYKHLAVDLTILIVISVLSILAFIKL